MNHCETRIYSFRERDPVRAYWFCYFGFLVICKSSKSLSPLSLSSFFFFFFLDILSSHGLNGLINPTSLILSVFEFQR